MKIEEIRRIKMELLGIKPTKQKFVIPNPGEKETQDEYISRCISAIVDEYGQEQGLGICYSQWEKK